MRAERILYPLGLHQTNPPHQSNQERLEPMRRMSRHRHYVSKLDNALVSPLLNPAVVIAMTLRIITSIMRNYAKYA